MECEVGLSIEIRGIVDVVGDGIGGESDATEVETGEILVSATEIEKTRAREFTSVPIHGLIIRLTVYHLDLRYPT